MSVTLISTVTVGAGGAASIDFTSIPGTYTDLMVVISARSTSHENIYEFDNLAIKPNGSTTSITVRNLLALVGTFTGSNTDTTLTAGAGVGNTGTSNTFSNVSITIPNYAGATNKSWSTDAVTENNATFGYLAISAGLWSNTSAITSLAFALKNGSFVQYSSATLYGITKGSSGGVTVS